MARAPAQSARTNRDTASGGASLGEVLTWDLNVERWEGGVGYHVSRDLLIKGVLQMTREAGDEIGRAGAGPDVLDRRSILGAQRRHSARRHPRPARL